MLDIRTIVPPPGNPMRAVFLMLTIFFPALLVGFPASVAVAGGPVGATVGIVILLGVVAVIALGALVMRGRAFERERHQLAADVLAAWRLTEDEYRRFARAERRRLAAWISGMLVIPLAFSVLVFLQVDDPRAGGSVLLVSLMIVGMILLVEMPPLRAGERTREVRIGARSVEAMGQYHELRGSWLRLDAVGLLPGDPAVLVIRVGAGNRSHMVRVPVPGDRLAEAQAIVEHLAPTPPTGETYPELLRRERARDARQAR